MGMCRLLIAVCAALIALGVWSAYRAGVHCQEQGGRIEVVDYMVVLMPTADGTGNVAPSLQPVTACVR